jgi:arginine/ornithine N-succinyltransferase beta subunit
MTAGEILTTVNLIHKSDVDFDVVEPIINNQSVTIITKDLMHHGEIFIYQDLIFLFDGAKWFKANIQEIKSIKSDSQNKQILIQFSDFDLVISCKEYSHLLALRDFLYLAQQNEMVDNILLEEVK